ncbi:MAG: extracellular solute-binding protein [Akkermansia sp.]
MKFVKISLLLIATGILTLLTGCDDSSNAQGVGWHSTAKEGTMPPGFEQFISQWNKSNKTWVEEQLTDRTEKLGKIRQEYVRTNDPSLMTKLVAATKDKEVFEARNKEGDYIKRLSPADIPTDLVWQDGLNNPEIGDPQAKKGGTVRLLAPGSFPDTFRPVGPNSNNGFRSKLYDEIDISLVRQHPENGQVIPGLAKQWAIGKDKRTVFFKLDEDATYSDGTKVRAIDFVVSLYICASEDSQSLSYKNAYREMVSHIIVYDAQTLSVTLPTQKPLLPLYCSLMPAFPPHFYSEFGPNYVERYQWRVPPTTGAYTINPEDMIRGRQVTMQRVQNWWAKDKKFFANTNNVDNLVYNFIADESKAIELFRIGELDMMLMNKPELWHERMEIPEVHNGFINRATFFTIYPRPPFGIFLNTARAPFNDKNTRIGFHHALNIQRIIDINFRGDYQRLGSYSSGYGRYTNANIKAREYSPEKAREYFASAGFTIACPDGILRKPDGTRLTAEITFANSTTSIANIMSQLKEDARKCGIDIQLDPLDSTVSFRKVMEKRHQSAFWAWSMSPPHPSLYQGLYSGYAYDAKGNTVPYTNNICSYSDPQMDQFVQDERDAATEEDLEHATHEAQRKIHEDAIWVPAWTTEFARIGYWRWVCWPQCKTTQFCFPLVFEPTESYLYWVDETRKKETLAGKRHGTAFQEIDAVYDQYRFREFKEDTGKDGDGVAAPDLPTVPVMVQPEDVAPTTPTPSTSSTPSTSTQAPTTR